MTLDTSNRTQALAKTALLKKAQVRRTLRWLQVLVGLPCLLFGVHYGEPRFHLVTQGTPMQGRVIAIEEISLGKIGQRRTAYMPKIEYEVGGKKHVFESDVGVNAGSIGHEVNILVDTANPTVAMLDHPVFNYFPWGLMVVIGVLLLSSALRYFLFTSRRESEAPSSRLRI